MNSKLCFMLVLCGLLLVGMAAAVENQGPEKISIYGGSQGNIGFPHHQHQNRIGDCQVCHDMFPQATDAIKDLKARGKLDRKEVMNKVCLNCHRAQKQAGKKAGPLTCSKCHTR